MSGGEGSTIRGSRFLGIAAFIGASLALVQLSPAEVASSSGNGFEVREAVKIAAPPARVYDRLVHPEAWWDDAHTFSGKAANLSLDAVASHCFCEGLPDGGTVEHLLVVYADPGKRLVLREALGPMQAMGVTGALTIALARKGDGTDLTLTYAVGGYAPGGFGDLSQKSDATLGEQASRLKKYIETGKPD